MAFTYGSRGAAIIAILLTWTYPSTMKNTYFVMRHGISVANEKDEMNGDPGRGVNNYGLTDEGRRQVEESIEKNKMTQLLKLPFTIISSDFLRCSETAELVRRAFGLPGVRIDIRLRERGFGSLESKSITNYYELRKEDELDDTNTKFGAESLKAVFERMWPLIEELEETTNQETYLLVSHGDPLRMLMTGFMGLSTSESCKIENLKKAEVRGPFGL